MMLLFDVADTGAFAFGIALSQSKGHIGFTARHGFSEVSIFDFDQPETLSDASNKTNDSAPFQE
ncbi:hypothetical protein WM40_11690 [Robbsia andropogonis]|uniref:Uncharacterized protein n=1 Tax=Robbsia andropogonis TaxID=28092 RepID=A0A0F5JZU0_9BURK|nr:hypothetical protein [Robbsia andropogonis]KKB63401.1 hypothetical protein WM40_11690 [Robbsia andropogonis]